MMRGLPLAVVATTLFVTPAAAQTPSPRTYATQMVSASCGAFSPDGATFLDSDGVEGSKVFLRSTETGEILKTLSLPHSALNASFSPDGRAVVIGGNADLTIWHLDDGKRDTIVETPPVDVGVAEYSRDGRYILTALDGSVTNWDAGLRRIVSSLGDANQSTGLVMNLEFNHDATRILTASNDMIGVWRANAGTLVAFVLDEKAETSVAHFSPDGARVVGSLSSTSIAHIWDATHLQEQLALAGHSGPVSDAQFSPDGHLVVTASQDKTARLWDAVKGKSLAILRGHTDAVNTAVFSPDGTRIVTGSEDKSVRLWDLTGKEIARFGGYASGIGTICFDKAGARLAIIGYEQISFRALPPGGK